MKNRLSRWAPLLVALAIGLVVSGCGGGSTRTSTSTQRMTLQLTSPTSRGSVTDSETTVTGVISEPSATVTVNDAEVDVGSDGSFTRAVPLAYGSNTITIRASAEGFRDTSRTVTITRNLTLDVTSPADDVTVSSNRITVAGSVSDPVATVHVQGYPVPVNPDGTFSRDLTLYYPSTIVSIGASVADREPITTNVTVTYPEAR